MKIAASCFSIYAYEALKKELEKIDSLEFIFTAPTFVPNEVTDKISKERKEFHIPKQQRERSLYGSEFEIQLKNKLTQRAIAKECAGWIRRKATFRSNLTKAPMQQFACLNSGNKETAYMPLHGFTAVDLGYQQGDAVSNLINKIDEVPLTTTYLQLFDQIWSDSDKLQDVTNCICTHIESVYQENSPEKIYFLTLYNIFNEFLEDLNEDVLPNDLTGYKNSIIWNKLFNFQRDAATGIINKLENYNRNLKTNILAKDRLNYDVLCHTDLQRTSGESFGTPLNKINWGNYDLVVIDESHNFRNNDAYKDKETRYKKLMNAVIRDGVKTKVLMLSATPVNNRFNDLRNQLALAYEGESENLSKKLRQADREKSLQSLMTTNLLKRLESSIESFRLTLGALEKNHNKMLSKIEQFKQSGLDFSIHDLANSLAHLEAEDDDLTGLDDFMIGGKVQVSLADMDLPSWEHDLKTDLFVITELLKEMKKVSPVDDSKLQHIKNHILEKIHNPINPGNKKIVIFTAFADTANYLYTNLSDELQSIGIHSGRVTGKDAPKTTLTQSNKRGGYDFQSILTLFSPISKEKALILPEESGEIDLLIGTDCISEGQNLQDCDYVINYDIHWNPVRIIQRFGRVDRIGSPNESIQLVNYWPDISLDEYINLKERVENRMHIVDIAGTGDDNVLSAKANDVTYRKEQLRRLQEEVIELEDLKTGVNITDLGLEVKEDKDIDSLFSGTSTTALVDTIKGLNDFELISFLVVQEEEA